MVCYTCRPNTWSSSGRQNTKFRYMEFTFLKCKKLYACESVLILQHFNLFVFILCILPPWGRKRGWPKRVGGHCACNCFNLLVCILLVLLLYLGPSISLSHYHTLWTAVTQDSRCSWLTETDKTVTNIGRKQSNSARGTPWLSWQLSLQQQGMEAAELPATRSLHDSS